MVRLQYSGFLEAIDVRSAFVKYCGCVCLWLVLYVHRRDTWIYNQTNNQPPPHSPAPSRFLLPPNVMISYATRLTHSQRARLLYKIHSIGTLWFGFRIQYAFISEYRIFGTFGLVAPSSKNIISNAGIVKGIAFNIETKIHFVCVFYFHI